MNFIHVELTSSRHRRVYYVDGAPSIQDHLAVPQQKMRVFYPGLVEMDVRDDNLVTLWVYSRLPTKNRGRAVFSNHDPDISPLTTAPSWLLRLVEKVVPNWKGVDND